MKNNVGSFDRIFRVIVAIVLAYLYYKNIVASVAGIILLVVSIVLLITGLIGFCPIYWGLRTGTKMNKKV